ncbi:MAG: hypothetical protein HBSAPP03_10140 [Phycisphaerae bacterium]|nr:MAG: hypothetical protein HBSAPP03_10140 [Phycisphaerae bacterium]
MRIIAGELRHRPLASPGDADTTRPYPDRVKESLFQLLRGHCEGAAVLDAFSGVGSIGLECVSRGALRVVMVEQDKRVAEFLRRNVEALGVGDRCDVVVGDALGAGALARCPRPLHLAFFDPPYALMEDAVGFARVMGQVSRAIALLDDTGFVVLRVPWPLTHVVGEVKPTSSRPRRFKPKASERERWKREMRRGAPARAVEETVDLTPEEIEAAMRGEAIEAHAAASPKPPRVTPDLTLPNASGPEVHEYRGMAVLLYMKKKG